MASGGIIAEFLASVGFQADEKSLQSALGKAKAFGLSIAAVATGAAVAVFKIADEYAALGRSAEHLKMPVAKLQELNYIAEQTVGSSDAVAKSLEGIVNKNPRIKDAAKALENAGNKMKRMSDAGRKAYAERMGIDPTLIPMLTRDVSGLRDEFAQMYAVAGTDAQAAAAESQGFIAEISKLKSMAVMLANAVGVAFIGRIRRDVERLRRGIMENFDKIKRAMEMVINFALRVVGAFTAMAGRLIGWIMKIINWFEGLEKSQQTVVKAILAIGVAWKALSVIFAMSPMGMVITGIALALGGVVALVDDYLTYMEGGESYFDWGPWEGTINKCIEALKPILGIVTGLASAFVTALGPAINTIMTAIRGIIDQFQLVGTFIRTLFTGDMQQIMAAGKAIIDSFTATIVGIFSGLVNTITTFFNAMWPSVQANFPDFAAWAEGAGKSITSFFGKAIQWVEDKLAFLTSWMPDWLKDDLGIKEVKITAPDLPASIPVAPVPGSNGLNRNVPAGAALTPSPFQSAALAQGAQGGKPVENNVDMKQQTTINVYSNGDPQAVGSAIAGRQGDVNGEMVRHTKGAIR